jgi:uncharacterized protein with von Willebrand factor type A (vWA) domain
MGRAEDGVTAALVGFGRLLRERGVAVGPGQLVRYQAALAAMHRADVGDLYWAGRACLVTGHQDLPAYEAAFAEHFFGVAAPPPGEPSPPGPGAEPPGANGRRPPRSLPGPRRDRLSPPAPEEEGNRAEPATVGETASSFEVLRHKTFPSITPADRATLDELLRKLRPGLPMRTTRRTRPSARGRQLDLRRSVRRSLRTEGELLGRHWRSRRRRHRTIVVLLDVSGSMASYSHALLQFAYGLGRSGVPVEVFCFGTRLTRITDMLRFRDPDDALERAAATVVDWDGGTRIGESLRQFVRIWGRQGFVRQSVLLICSDGLERGDPALLGEQLARLARLCHRIVWVNPLAGDPAFEPVSRGMRAALPYLDDLVAGDTFESLALLARALGGDR